MGLARVIVALSVVAACSQEPRTAPIRGDEVRDGKFDRANDGGTVPDAERPDAAEQDSGPLVDTGDFGDPVQPIASVRPDQLLNLPLGQSYPGDVLFYEDGGGCLSRSTGVVELGQCQDGALIRWTVTVDGQVQVADDPTQCLDVDPHPTYWGFLLSDCGQTSYALRLESGVLRAAVGNQFVFATRVAEPAPGQPNIQLFGGDGSGWPGWRRLSQLEAAAQQVVQYPLPLSNANGYEVAIAQSLLSQMLPPYAIPSPDPTAFAGSIPSDEPRVSRRIAFNRRFEHDTDYLRAGATPRNWQPTGLYAAPGETLAVEVPANAAPGLRVVINVHTDPLTPESGNVKNVGEYRRPPLVTSTFELEPGVNAVRSAFGGMVVLESTQHADEVNVIDVHGGIAQPRFVRGLTSSDNWRARRTLRAPYAVLEGEHMVLVVPSTQIRSLDDPAAVLARYDHVATRTLELSGLDADAPEHEPYDGRHWFVTDRQINHGYGHAGFPVMVVPAWNLARQDAFGDGWGVWHELGHNHQQFRLWSTRFGTEVNVNIFSLDLNETYQSDGRIGPAATKMVAQLLQGPISWEAVGDLTDQLVFFAQPTWATPKGYDMYATVFRGFRELSDERARQVEQTDQLKTDYLYRFMSEGAALDLVGHFERWGFSPSQAAKGDVAALGLSAPASPVWSLTGP